MRLQAPRGTHDVLPTESPTWRFIESTFAELVRLYGYEEIRTPTFEDTDLFVRSAGETSEVVSKQMYSFVDKGDRNVTLKPEGTAPVIRAYLEHRLGQPGQTTRLWYATPIFRYERPQKGRYRQAHQVGFELIGSDSPSADAEVIEITVRFYERLGLSGLSVLVNSLGRDACRASYREALMKHALPYLQTLGPESVERAERNPLRLLDTKDADLLAVMKSAPSILDFLEPECRERFEQLQQMLHDREIQFEVRPDIVRGLDYYTETVFEVTSTDLGAQSSLCGGGRYDHLIEELGGPPTPSVGVAMGVERAALVLESQGLTVPANPPFVYVASLGGEANGIAWKFADACRIAGISTISDISDRPVKAKFKAADRAGCAVVAAFGSNEIAHGSVTLKRLASGESMECPISDAVALLQSWVSK